MVCLSNYRQTIVANALGHVGRVRGLISFLSVQQVKISDV